MGSVIGFVAVVVLIILLLVLIISNIVIVQQSRAYVVERLGAFRAVWNVGLHLKIPFIERVVKKVSLKEQVADFAPQPVRQASVRIATSKQESNFFIISSLKFI